MIIKFKKVILKNFMSFKDASLDLDNSGYILVEGKNNYVDDSAKSNGSGKSSIWESIIWALTGNTIRDTKDIVNQNSTDGARVELYLDIDKDSYKIIRSKDDKELGTNLKIYINGEDKSGKGIRDSEKLLQQYLPDLNASLLGSVIILGQGLPQRFTNNTPSGRKEVLEKLSKSDFMILDIKDKLSNRKQKLNDKIRVCEDNMLSLQTKSTMIINQIQSYKNQIEELSSIDFDRDIEYNNQILEMKTAEYNNTNELAENSKIELDQVKEKSYTIKATLNEEKNAEYEKYLNTCKPLNEEINSLSAQSKSLDNEITRLKNVKDICPTCGQKLSNVHKVDTSEMEIEYNQLIDNLNIVKENLKQQKDIYDNWLSSYNEKVANETKSITERLSNLEDNYSNQSKCLNSLNSDINKLKLEIDKLNLKKKQKEENLTNIEKSKDECEEQLTKINESLLYNNNEKDTLKSHLDIVNKMTTIATRDFRGYLLSSIIDFIALQVKQYSMELFSKDAIKFELDGNNILISYNGRQYENLSGGEKQKTDVCIQFAIRDMLSQYLDFKSNILVLDEIFDNLDSYGCKRLIDLITDKLTSVESIYIITHHSDELMIPYDSVIQVEKDVNGISRIL